MSDKKEERGDGKYIYYEAVKLRETREKLIEISDTIKDLNNNDKAINFHSPKDVKDFQDFLKKASKVADLLKRSMKDRLDILDICASKLEKNIKL